MNDSTHKFRSSEAALLTVQAEQFLRIELLRRIRMLATPLAALIVLVTAIAFVQPKFLSLRALSALGTDAAPMLALVLGASIVILIGAIDLSIATMASFSAVMMVILNPLLGDGAVVCVLLTAGIVGAIQGYAHAKLQIPSFVVSFGTLGILYGITHFVTRATAAPLSAPSVVMDYVSGKSFGIPNGLIVIAACAYVLLLAFSYTRLGRDLYAIGSSERAALIAGVKIVRVKMIAFAISSICASIAGLLLLAQTRYSSPAMANTYLLPVIVGAVVGGTAISGGIGGIGSALIGGTIAAVVRVGTVMVGLNPAFQNIAFGLVILVAVALTIDREKIGIIK